MNKRCKCRKCKHKTKSNNDTMVEIETRPVPTIEKNCWNENKYLFYNDGRVELNPSYSK